MDYKQHLLDEIGRKTDEIREIALSFQRMARDTEVFLGRYQERRSNPRRANRMPSYSERKAIERGHLEMNDELDVTVNLADAPDFDPTLGEETTEMGNDLSRTPTEDLALGRYEKALIEKLGALRMQLKTYYERYQYGNPLTRQDNLSRVRTILGLIRLAQRQLNATGHWNFGLV